MFNYIILLSCAVIVSSHLCLINPHQRGPLGGLNVPGAEDLDCNLTAPPCGGRPREQSILSLKADSNLTVVFQKNIGYFDPALPGNFTISVGADENSFTELVTFEDSETKDLYLHFIHDVVVPSTLGHHIFQVTYVTSPGVVYYQCADITVI
ncbi:hypothetical protein EB796_023939 [Bugula neritina]|uniref:Uncharacterized protein n=1 Tax=Bugula neritina TaxID=10212 RepID=A0A7J7IWX8_BUGNE|nr:hypothetical protein EB796_023939 [Bugula neritina]